MLLLVEQKVGGLFLSSMSAQTGIYAQVKQITDAEK